MQPMPANNPWEAVIPTAIYDKNGKQLPSANAQLSQLTTPQQVADYIYEPQYMAAQKKQTAAHQRRLHMRNFFGYENK